MPQLDPFTYFTQFFWLCLFLFSFFLLFSIYVSIAFFKVSQWCQSVDFLGKTKKALTSDTIPEDDLELENLRLLEVDNRVVVPANTHLRLIVTSADVLHSWALPSLGVKCDAVPGRLNQISILVQREGVYYGQCSEIYSSLSMAIPLILTLGIFFITGSPVAFSDESHSSPGVEAPQLPQFHVPVDDAAPPLPVIPEFNPPLLPEALRLTELAQSLHVSFLGTDYSWRTHTRFVETLDLQSVIDRRIQDGLVHEGYSPAAVVGQRGAIRDVLFKDDNGRLITVPTLRRWEREIALSGTLQSRPFARVVRAIGRLDIIMPLPRRPGR